MKPLALRFSPASRVAAAILACAVGIGFSPSAAFAWPNFFSWVLSEFQPDINPGGRPNTIAVNPANNDIIIVASESGGLFRSMNRGRNWSHVDSLPAFSTGAVAFVPADPNVVIATTGEDFKVANGGGIWRSTDGGASWTQLPSPAAPPVVTDRFGAGEISIAPDTGNIFVATPYGVSISTDRGATWTLVDAVGGGDHRVFSVLAQNGNHVLAGASAGVRRSTDGGMTWSWATTGPGGISDMHAFGRSPYSQDQAYVVNGNTELYYTEDAGDHWTRITSAPGGGGGCGGITFVKPIGRRFLRPGSGWRGRRSIDLYFGNRCRLAKLSSPSIPGTTRFNYGGTWVPLNSDHGDTRDLAFDALRRPLLLATDGGLHQTADGGLNWTFVGGGAAGYNALQITEVKGQWIDDIGRYDMYFGTQDNDLWSSGDDGVSWTMGARWEGFFIEAKRRVARESDSKATFVACAGCGNFVSGSLFSSVAGWPNPTGPLAGNPKIVRNSFHVQGVDATSPSLFSKGLAVTTDFGTSWQQYVTLPEERRDLPKLSDPPATRFRLRVPVLYQSIRTGFDATRNFEINHLARIVKRRSTSGATVSYPAMNNFGGLGINPTMFAWYQVFAVDPGNTSHLLGPDIVNEKMMETWDCGDNWTEIPQLTSLVTDSGRLLFRRWMFPQASAISFSPGDPRLVAVGTWEGGIFISADRGATWEKVPGSEKATYITSLEWRTAHDVIVSTYGRGLWRLKWKAMIRIPDLEYLCNIRCLFGPFDKRWMPDPPPDRFENGIVVYEGRIQGARAVNGVLKELFVWPGSSVAFVADSNKVPEIKVTETTKRVGFIGVKGASRIPAQGPVLAGLAIGRRGEIVGTLVSDKALSAAVADEKEKSDEERVGSEQSPTAGKPYLELLGGRTDGANGFAPGEPIQLSGRGFPIGMAIVIAIDDRPVEKTVVGHEGRFSARVPAPREFGLHSLTARDGASGKVIDGTMVLVRHGDADEGKERPKPRKTTRSSKTKPVAKPTH